MEILNFICNIIKPNGSHIYIVILCLAAYCVLTPICGQWLLPLTSLLSTISGLPTIGLLLVSFAYGFAVPIGCILIAVSIAIIKIGEHFNLSLTRNEPSVWVYSASIQGIGTDFLSVATVIILGLEALAPGSFIDGLYPDLLGHSIAAIVVFFIIVFAGKYVFVDLPSIRYSAIPRVD